MTDTIPAIVRDTLTPAFGTDLDEIWGDSTYPSLGMRTMAQAWLVEPEAVLVFAGRLARIWGGVLAAADMTPEEGAA